MNYTHLEFLENTANNEKDNYDGSIRLVANHLMKFVSLSHGCNLLCQQHGVDYIIAQETLLAGIEKCRNRIEKRNVVKLLGFQ